MVVVAGRLDSTTYIFDLGLARHCFCRCHSFSQLPRTPLSPYAVVCSPIKRSAVCQLASVAPLVRFAFKETVFHDNLLRIIP